MPHFARHMPGGPHVHRAIQGSPRPGSPTASDFAPGPAAQVLAKTRGLPVQVLRQAVLGVVEHAASVRPGLAALDFGDQALPAVCHLDQVVFREPCAFVIWTRFPTPATATPGTQLLQGRRRHACLVEGAGTQWGQSNQKKLSREQRLPCVSGRGSGHQRGQRDKKKLSRERC